MSNLLSVLENLPPREERTLQWWNKHAGILRERLVVKEAGWTDEALAHQTDPTMRAMLAAIRRLFERTGQWPTFLQVIADTQGMTEAQTRTTFRRCGIKV